MGSAFWAQPAKRLDRELRDMGARRAERNAISVAYRMPDGARIDVPKNIGPGAARVLLSRIQFEYGHKRGVPLGDARKASRAPRIDLERLTASDHAKDRLRLMQRQGSVTFQEVLRALRLPERVLWSETHQSWLWVRDRLAVAVWVAANGHATIGTIMWATADLWEANPRPA